MKKLALLLWGIVIIASSCTLIDERFTGIGVWTSPSSGAYDKYGDEYVDRPYYSSMGYSPWRSPMGFGWYSWNPFFAYDPYFYLWSYSMFGYYGFNPYYYPSRYFGGYGYGGWSGSGYGYGYGRVDRTVVSKDSLQRLGSSDGTVRRIRKSPSPGSPSSVSRATTTRSSSAGRSGTVRSSGTSRSSGGSRSSGSSGGGRSAGGGSIRKK